VHWLFGGLRTSNLSRCLFSRPLSPMGIERSRLCYLNRPCPPPNPPNPGAAHEAANTQDRERPPAPALRR
jgi:hypothetical protein